jgi:exodeoxyribonuclease VII large subunit
VLIVPVRVQGEQSAGEIADAIDYVNYYKLADLIITGRGGGSIEDLWAFNEEVVARAIYRSDIPVISAVGHEPDVTISDFVADLRAATPSNAAELAVPDREELVAALAHLGRRLERGVGQPVSMAREKLERMRRSRVLDDPKHYFAERRVLLDYQGRRLLHGLERSLAQEKARFGRLAAALDAMSPLKVLGRGYAIAQKEDGQVLTSPEQVEVGQKLHLRLRDGSLSCCVEERK